MIKDNVHVCVFVSRDESDVDHCTSKVIRVGRGCQAPAPARPVTFSPLLCKYLGNVGREISHWKARSSGAYQGPHVQILGQLR